MIQRLPVFGTAFRIFFLACAMHATVAIALWLLKLRGIDIVSTNNSPIFWHTYEMVFGFSRAAIFGFLFTAGQNWSGKFLLGGNSALTLFLLWFAGRCAFFLPSGFSAIAFAADLVAGAYALYRLRPLLLPQQKHNHEVVYLFAIYLLGHAAAVATLFVAQLSEYFFHTIRFGLLTVVFFIVLIGGRVVPFFTSVVIPGEKPRILPRLEQAIWPLTLTALGFFALSPLHPIIEKLTAIVFLGCASLHGVRWYFWRPFATLKIPILLILYVGYLWLVVGFVAISLSIMGWLPASPAWHMFGIGAAGIFIYGMITRVALGHTGRPIRASSLVSAGYVMLNLALLMRVILPLGGRADLGYLFAALLWIVSFAIYLLRYAPVLVRRRIDGKAG